MSNNEKTGPSDQDADKMDYEGEQEYLDYLTAKQGLQVGLDDGTDADIDTDGAGTDGGVETDGGAETGGEGTGGDDTGGKVPPPMPLPKRRSRRSKGYENLTN